MDRRLGSKASPELEPTQVEGGAKPSSSGVFTVNAQGRVKRTTGIGQPFGRYTLIRRLASGGMGEIFLALQGGQGGFSKLVAIKRILAHYKEDNEHVRMFFDEAKLQAILADRHVVQIYDMGEIDEHLYIAMEFVHGVSWRRLLERAGDDGRIVHPAHGCDLAVQVCRGLSYAHNVKDGHGKPLDVVHRDINPQNLIVSYEGEVKIIDFGIAKSAMNEVQTTTGTLKGKFNYMSPEQGNGKKLDRRSDVFSFGLCLYELLAKQNPFKRANVVATLAAIQAEELPPLARHRPDCAVFQPILEKALAKKPEDRYADCGEIAEELIELYASGAIPEPKIPLATWLQEMFAEEIEDHLALLDRVSSRSGAGGMAVRGAPIVSNPSLAGPYSPGGELSASKRRLSPQSDAETQVLPGEDELSYELSESGSGSTDLALPGPGSHTAESPPPSMSGGSGGRDATGAEPLLLASEDYELLDSGEELAGLPSVSQEGQDRPVDVGLGDAPGKGDTDPTVSSPSMASTSGPIARPARGRSLVLGTLSGLVIGLLVIGGLLFVLGSDPAPGGEALAEGEAPVDGEPGSDAEPATDQEQVAAVGEGDRGQEDEAHPQAGAASSSSPSSSSSEPVAVGPSPDASAGGSSSRRASSEEDGSRDSTGDEDAPPSSSSSEPADEGAAEDKSARREEPKRVASAAARSDDAAAKEDQSARREKERRAERRSAPRRAEPRRRPKPAAKRAAPAPEPVGVVSMRLPSGYRASPGGRGVARAKLYADKPRTVTVRGPDDGYTVKLVFRTEGGKTRFTVSSEPRGIIRVNNVGKRRGQAIDLPASEQLSLIVKSPRVDDELKLTLKLSR